MPRLLNDSAALSADMYKRRAAGMASPITNKPAYSQFVPNYTPNDMFGGSSHSLGHGAGPIGMRLSRSF